MTQSESESEEITLDISIEEGKTNGPLQSSALAGGNLNIQDMSTINQGTKAISFSLINGTFPGSNGNESQQPENDSDLVIHGKEDDSNDVFLNWVPDKSLSFSGNGNSENLDESWLELGESKLKIASSKSGKRDKSGKKYNLVAYCIDVSHIITYNP